MGHFGNPKYAQMSPNGDPQMCLHNDVSKNQFSVIICPIFDPFNTRRWAFRLDAVLIFTFSPDRHFSPSKAGKVSKLAPKWSSKSDKMSLKRHPKYMFFFTPAFDSFFDQKRTPKWSPKWHWSHFWGIQFSHVVPDLVLGATFVNFGVVLGSPGLHFGFILVPVLAPEAPMLVPTAYVLEFLDNPFLEHLMSHTDMNTLQRHAYFRICYPMS